MSEQGLDSFVGTMHESTSKPEEKSAREHFASGNDESHSKEKRSGDSSAGPVEPGNDGDGVIIQYREGGEPALEGILALYRANEWSSAEKPELLHRALLASHALVTAWAGSRLVGLGNAISDGCLVVYYPHLLVLPEYRGRGIGRQIMRLLLERYTGFHQHILIADGRTVEFYRKCGFERAGGTEPMWIYAGHDH